MKFDWKFKNLSARWPLLKSATLRHWRHLLRSLSPAELNLILIWLALAILAATFLAGYDYWFLRIAGPQVGGSYQEGLIGEPRYLNPVLATTNEVDRDITTLIFSGLVKHDEASKIVPDLAANYEIKDNGKTYEFTLKENLVWPDGEKLSSDDVVFTLNLIKDPHYQSPLRNNWQGVKVERVDDRKIRLRLSVAYAPFLENATVGILPKHLWAGIQPQNFLLTQLNIKPVGLGQYQLRKITKNAAGSIKSIELEPNPHYPQKAYIARLTLRFYETQENLLTAYKKREVDGLALLTNRQKEEINKRQLVFYNLVLPRYFAVFLNQTKNNIFKDPGVRLALAYATNQDSIVNDILKGDAQKQTGPFPEGTPGLPPPKISYEFNMARAQETLERAGWKDSDGDGQREKKLSGQKNATALEFVLTTTDWPELTQVASALKEDWEKLGAKVSLDIVPINAIQTQSIRSREYQALLFGEVLGIDPDPFSFWHSSQRKDPGLNLALYNNKQVDDLLESARQILDADKRTKKYEEFQNIIMRELPAIFLYSPNFIYALPTQIKGMATGALNTPSQRFENINKWYIETRRVKK